MPASGWKLVGIHPTKGRTFQRALDTAELSFIWDGLFNGTVDVVQHFELRLLNSSRHAQLFSMANIVRAWLSTKRRYPLVGATVRGFKGRPYLGETTGLKAEGGDGHDKDYNTGLMSDPHFVVQEHELSVLRPHEIVFGWVNSAEEAKRRSAAILDGPRPLSEELLVKLYVFHETERTDVLHLVALMAHCVTDGVANYTFMRCLFDTLARDVEPPQVPLEDRLAMTIPSLELEPMHLHSLSPAKRRWRRIVGAVIFQLKMEKRQGGHTLPCRITPSTPHVAARSGHISISLSLSQSAIVLANCRLHDITFGNAYLPIAQAAMTRVLYRRYLRGEISEEEWLYRQRQPHISGGPLNLRPYLDKSWFDRGGGGEFMLSIAFFFYELPFMTVGATTVADQHRQNERECILLDGAPPFSELLDFDRFLHRAGLVKKQAAAFFSHPLFFEIVCAMNRLRAERTRLGALQWMHRVANGDGNGAYGRSGEDQNGVLSAMNMPMVWAHGGSNVGSVDLMSPLEYPIPFTHPLSPCSSVPHPMKAGYVTPTSASPSFFPPKIVVEHTDVFLHTRPSELYLGASSSHGGLNMFVFYDRNVFEDDVVREWLDEVKGAVLWYLGRTHYRSGRVGKNYGGDGNERVGFGEGVRANL